VSGPLARVVLLSGPSGSGKSHIAARSGLPVFQLDDFYLDVDDPSLPISAELGIPDWDDPRSWNADAAIAALERLCRDGRATVPTYDMSRSVAVGERVLELGGARAVVAEGIFAASINEELSARGLLADCVLLHRPAWRNFVQRLVRDIRDHREPVPVLWRRGRLLMADEPRIVAEAIGHGCRPVTPGELSTMLAGLAAPQPTGANGP
jgi:uridine kinase